MLCEVKGEKSKREKIHARRGEAKAGGEPKKNIASQEKERNQRISEMAQTGSMESLDLEHSKGHREMKKRTAMKKGMMKREKKEEKTKKKKKVRKEKRMPRQKNETRTKKITRFRGGRRRKEKKKGLGSFSSWGKKVENTAKKEKNHVYCPGKGGKQKIKGLIQTKIRKKKGGVGGRPWKEVLKTWGGKKGGGIIVQTPASKRT